MENKKVVNLLRSLADILDVSDNNETTKKDSTTELASDSLTEGTLTEAQRILGVMRLADKKIKEAKSKTDWKKIVGEINKDKLLFDEPNPPTPPSSRVIKEGENPTKPKGKDETNG